MKKVYHLTKQGKTDLESELKKLTSSRKAIAEEIAIARQNGDLSENAEYTAAREKQNRVESRIEEIENILKGAEIITSDGDGVVSLGDTVELMLDDKKIAYTIVGQIEANPLENKISHESPLGSALIGKKVNDSVTIKTPKGDNTYKITSIE